MPEPQQHFSRLCSAQILFAFVDFVYLVTGCIRLSACASEDVPVCLLCAWKRTRCLFLAKNETCRLHYIFMIISLCPCVSSFRFGVTSRPFSLPSTVAPPTWWWLCGSPCPSGNISWKNIATWQLFLGLIWPYSTHSQCQWSPFICCDQRENWLVLIAAVFGWRLLD